MLSVNLRGLSGRVGRRAASSVQMSATSVSDHGSVRATTAVRCESALTIAAPVPDVWAYLCDLGRWPEWAPTVLECWAARGAALHPGLRVEQRAKGPLGFSRHRAQHVTVVDAPHRLAFAGPMGTSAARWGMELAPLDGARTEAMMWVEVDRKTVMRAIPRGVLGGRIRRVMDREMAAITAAVESDTDHTRGHLLRTYRRKAKHYDVTSQLYPVPGYPQRAYRARAIHAADLRAGDTVVDIACGTGLNFAMIERAIGPGGRIVGVDLTDAMLAQAERRIARSGWSNISLVQADAAEFGFPAGVDAIVSTYALTQVPECGEVIVRGAEALSPGGRWAVLDLKLPGATPRWMAQLGITLLRPFGSVDQWTARRPWEAIRAGMQDSLAELSWTELALGTAFLAAGRRGGPAQPSWNREESAYRRSTTSPI